MGIDYYSCAYCYKGFPNVQEYVSCQCDVFCSEKCARKQGVHIPDYSDFEDTVDESEIDAAYDKAMENLTCMYCRQEDFTDKQLLEYLMNVLGISREALVEKYEKYGVD